MATRLTAEQKAYNRGARESVRERKCDGWACPCTLTYWDFEIADESDAYKTAFMDGWVDAATGENEYRPTYFPEEKTS